MKDRMKESMFSMIKGISQLDNRQKCPGLISSVLKYQNEDFSDLQNQLQSCNTNLTTVTSNTLTTTYTTLNYPSEYSDSSTLITGVRGVTGSSDVYISGFTTSSEYNTFSFIYNGNILGGGTWYTFNYPSSTGVTVNSTALYGPNNGNTAGTIQVVGNYATVETGMQALGCLYQGPLDGSGSWSTINPQSVVEDDTVINTIAHSNMGGLVVGNFDTLLVQGKAFVYDITNNWYNELTYPSAISITAYGIWYKGGTEYSITGGLNLVRDLDVGYIATWDSSQREVLDWKFYHYHNQATNSTISHFEGITASPDGIDYNLVSDYTLKDGTIGSSFVQMLVNGTASRFGEAIWVDYAYPDSLITSANTVYKNYALGIYQTEDQPGISKGYVVEFS